MSEPWEKEVSRIEGIKRLSREEAKQEIILYEAWVDENLLLGNISQKEAWDMYFGLLHECDERHLREDRERIVKKIDTKRYNPFSSKDPQVIFLAQFRARAMGLMRHESN